jgi:hypothetical protein
MNSDQELASVLASLSPTDRAKLEQYVANGQFVRKDETYYSRVRIAFTVTTGGSPVVSTLTYAAGSIVTAFSYGKGDVPTSAGFPTTFGVAYDTETNLLAKTETNGQEVNIIRGIGIQLHPDTDIELARLTLPELYVSGGFSGDNNQFKFGPAHFLCGGAGLYGGGDSLLATANLAESRAMLPGFPAIGQPLQLNYKALSEPILWFPKGGGAESSWNVRLWNPRAITATGTARAAATGVAAFAPPAATGDRRSFFDMWVKLEGIQIAPRGKNR